MYQVQENSRNMLVIDQILNCVILGIRPSQRDLRIDPIVLIDLAMINLATTDLATTDLATINIAMMY